MSSSSWRDEWNRRYAGSELLWTAQPNRFLVAEADGLEPGTALDLACGEGRNAVWLAEQGWSVTGVDFAGVALAKARELAAHRGVEAEWVEADLLEYRANRRFDLVLSFYLQLAAGERRRVLRSAGEAVAPGGMLLVVAHDASNLQDGYGGPKEPAVLYSPAEVVGDLDGTGLVVERASVVERPVETSAGERIALDLLVRARRESSRG